MQHYFLGETYGEDSYLTTLMGSAKKLNYDFYSVRWEGKLKAPESGFFKLGWKGEDGYRIFLDGDMIIGKEKREN